MNPKSQIIKSLQNVISELELNKGSDPDGSKGVGPLTNIQLEVPEREEFGDYSTNVAMQLWSNFQARNTKHETNNKISKGKNANVTDLGISNLGFVSNFDIDISNLKSPRDLAQVIVDKLSGDRSLKAVVDKIEVAGGGFINFHLAGSYLTRVLGEVLKKGENFGKSDSIKDKKIMVEFAHPNTHKELHIGHMRTLILGESLSRILEFAGADVFRANYQGDVGPHVAKAIWGTEKLLAERNSGWDEAEKLSVREKAHLLGEGYVRGSTEYDQNKAEIDSLNTEIYKNDPSIMPVYKRTRQWSLDYYDEFYRRFGTTFNKLYFESEVFVPGKEIVLRNIPRVFEESEGAVVFKGEQYNLHTRVFITKDGNPTYEAKDMGLAYQQFSDFPFDRNIHVVANEQQGYFQVILKALELIDDKFKDREYHLPMGMVNLVGLKMSSRTGEILRVDQLLDDVKGGVKKLAKDKDEEMLEAVTLGAIKCSMLRVHPTADVAFDIGKSISLEGDSGPYLQYTFARIQSVLQKAKGLKLKAESQHLVPVLSEVEGFSIEHLALSEEELKILRSITHFPEVVEKSAQNLAPNLLCNYLFDLASKFNSFYNSNKILVDDPLVLELRLGLTSAVGIILKTSLGLLGIQAPEKM